MTDELEVISIPVHEVYVPDDYVRHMNEAEAQRLARLIEAEGQRTPIAVYWAPARNSGKTPYTLIYGARRLRAIEILGRGEIKAVRRTAKEARLLQVTDNLAARSLDALEEAQYLAAYRELWKAEYGPVSRGGDRRSKRQHVALIDDAEFSRKPNFYKDLENSFGIQKRSAQRLLKISENLRPSLMDSLRHTAAAKNQALLLKLSKMPFDDQAALCGALKIEPDPLTALKIVQPGKGRQDRKTWNFDRFCSAWNLMNDAERRAALTEIGAIMRPLPEGFGSLPKLAVSAVPRPGLDSPLWDFCRLPEERRLGPIDEDELMTAVLIQDRQERQVPIDVPNAGVTRTPLPRNSDATINGLRPKRATLARSQAKALSKELERKIGSFPPRLWWALKIAGVLDHISIVRNCYSMDAERQEKLLPKLRPGREPRYIERDCAMLIDEQREDYRNRQKDKIARRYSYLKSRLVQRGAFKGLIVDLAERLGEPNKNDRELIGVLQLLDIKKQAEVIERLNVGRTLNDIYDWACDQIRDDAA